MTMTAIVETSGAIDRSAAMWAARIDRGLNDDEHAALADWMAADTRRRGALTRALAVVTAIDAREVAPAVEAQLASRRRVLFAGGALAAGVAAAIAVPVAVAHEPTYVTAKGQLRTVALQDGSRILLNTDSSVRVRYGPRRRLIELHRGEALFDVAHDAARPFVVRSRGLDVRAIGTSFSVARLDGRPLEVRVRQGFVEVAGDGPDAPPPTHLMPGCRAVATEAGEVVVRHVGVPAVLRLMSWRRGELDLDGLSLSEAVAEFRRYSDRRIVLDDPAIGREPVAGRYRASEPQAFAAAAATTLNLRLRRDGDVIHLAR